jgi:exocyst complex component 1
MGALEKYISEWEDTDQTFITRTLQKQHDKLGGIFHRFIEEQTRSIEDMKVTAKKRQGVLLMFKIFPVRHGNYPSNIQGFVERIEAQFNAGYFESTLDVRDTVNDGYASISKTMFDSLQAIAKDTSSHQNSGTKDDEDKELLNSHISMVENMHYYRETVDAGSNPILIKYKIQAQNLLSEHLGLYIKAVIRRPLGKLLVLSWKESI